MIGEPLNDVDCLSKITAQAAAMVDSPELRQVAGRFGTADELAAWIRERGAGIDTFRAWVDGGNAPMLDILEQLGAVFVEEEEGTRCLDVPVPADAEHLPDTPAGRALRAAACEELALRPVMAPGG